MFAWVSFSENVRNRGKAIFEDFDVVTYALNLLKMLKTLIFLVCLHFILREYIPIPLYK